jgi:hypothetical protein
MVETLIDGIVESGIHEIQWNAGNQASGIYFVRLESGDIFETQKVILMK